MNGKTRRALACSCVVAFVGMAREASADWHSFWHSVEVDYQRNNAWPQPFTDDSVRQTIAPFEVMKHNGWRLHNTIGHELFREGDGALLASGHRRVNWIASQAPADRRVIYVLRGRSAAETEARLASVRDTLSRVQINGPAPQLMITEIEPTTASGAWATQINRDWLEALPPPKLPSTSSTGAAGATEGG
ncbi:MAG: hypothetical protein ACO1RT_16030 [Planctomycetaceae bacterium]